MVHTISKKRQRPLNWKQSNAVGASLISMVSMASLTILSSQSFASAYIATPTRIRHMIPRKSSLVETIATLSEESPTQEDDDLWFAEQRDNTDTFELPPWLQRFQERSDDLSRRLEWLEYALMEQDLSSGDVRDIIDLMETASAGDTAKFVGMIEFCHLLLSLEEPSTDQHVFVTKEVLLASVLHYGDCISARETGVYELVKQACEHRTTVPEGEYLLSPGCEIDEDGPRQAQSVSSDGVIDVDELENSAVRVTGEQVSELVRSGLSSMLEPDVEDEVMRIAGGAARIKQIEILAHAVLGEGRTPSPEQASRLRSVLLSVTEDWRGLAIRSAASLFRLEGIFSANQGSAEYLERTPQVIQTARDALRIYAPLAQRLGMQRLKSKLEGLAFRILYRRQYEAVSALYRQNGAAWGAREAMQSISTYLTTQITQALHSDEKLMAELQDVDVTARVKEPYSLWKKLLKSRLKKKKSTVMPLLKGSSGNSLPSQEDISVLEVLDAIALRIVLKAKKWTPEEPDDVTRDRERLLCYYVQKKLLEYWPAVDESRIKDYIQTPKPNGYQSLHYTSTVACFGEEWPFEVQVRSQEMHRVAEYGVAAHWDYKMKGNKNLLQIAPSPSSHPSYSTSFLPSTLETDTDTEVSILSEEDTVPAVVDDEKDDESLSSAHGASIDSYIDALVTARENLVESKVFVFLAGPSEAQEKGQILSLPVGAKVVDALTLFEAQEGEENADANYDPQVFRNGRLAQLDEYVRTGDLLLVKQ